MDITEKEALENIYKYVDEHKDLYTFEREGIYFYIRCDVILKVVEINITGVEIEIMVDDGVDIYTETIKNMEYAKKFTDMIAREYDHTQHKKRKYGKNDRRQFFNIVKKLKK